MKVNFKDHNSEYTLSVLRHSHKEFCLVKREINQ